MFKGFNFSNVTPKLYPVNTLEPPIESPIKFKIENGEVQAEFTGTGISNVTNGVYREKRDDATLVMNLNDKTIGVTPKGRQYTMKYDLVINDQQLEELRKWAEEKTTPTITPPKTGGRKSRKPKRKNRAPRKTRRRRY